MNYSEQIVHTEHFCKNYGDGTPRVIIIICDKKANQNVDRIQGTHIKKIEKKITEYRTWYDEWYVSAQWIHFTSAIQSVISSFSMCLHIAYVPIKIILKYKFLLGLNIGY